MQMEDVPGAKGGRSICICRCFRFHAPPVQRKENRCGAAADSVPAPSAHSLPDDGDEDARSPDPEACVQQRLTDGSMNREQKQIRPRCRSGP